MQSRLVYIYALVDPRDGRIHYVGKTARSLEERLSEHTALAGGNPVKQAWIRDLQAVNMTPQIQLLEMVDEAEWPAAERRWIEEGQKRGWPLTNISKGGGPNYHAWANEIARLFLDDEQMAIFEQLALAAKIDVCAAPARVGVRVIRQWAQDGCVERGVMEQMEEATHQAMAGSANGR